MTCQDVKNLIQLNMIAKPEWFKRRKYLGWGVYPKTKEGWIYLVLIILPFAIFNALPFWSEGVRIGVLVAWLLFLAIDIGSVMVKLNKDERERIHEAFAERNALWVMLLVLIVGIGYETAVSTVAEEFKVDIFLIMAIVLGLFTKAISNLYLDKKD